MNLCNKVIQAEHNQKSHYMLATFQNIETINNRGMLVEFEGHIENDKSKFLIPEKEQVIPYKPSYILNLTKNYMYESGKGIFN